MKKFYLFAIAMIGFAMASCDSNTEKTTPATETETVVTEETITPSDETAPTPADQCDQTTPEVEPETPAQK